MNIIEISIRLKSLLDRMDVPEQRKTDFDWLLRNLGIRNSSHADFSEAIGLIKEFKSLKSEIFNDEND